MNSVDIFPCHDKQKSVTYSNSTACSQTIQVLNEHVQPVIWHLIVQ